jgi:hypothetical protein
MVDRERSWLTKPGAFLVAPSGWLPDSHQLTGGPRPRPQSPAKAEHTCLVRLLRSAAILTQGAQFVKRRGRIGLGS